MTSAAKKTLKMIWNKSDRLCLRFNSKFQDSNKNNICNGVTKQQKWMKMHGNIL